MLINTEGIVLKQRKIANNRRMIVIFTRQYGKISAGTSISEKGRSKSALVLRPFTHADYDLSRGRESFSINSASVIRSYYSIGEDLGKFSAASAFIDYLDKVLEDEEPMPGLFGLALEFMDSVSRAKGDPLNLLFAFIVKSFRLLGVMPELENCVNCGRPLEEFGYDNGNGVRCRQFSVTSGGTICEECAEEEKREADALICRPSFDIIEVFRFFMNKPLSTFEKVSLKPAVSEYIRKVLAEYTRLYLGADVLSSIREMEE